MSAAQIFAKMVARQVGPGLTEEIFLPLTDALFFTQPAKPLEGLARAGAVGRDGLLRRPLAQGKEEVDLFLNAGIGTHPDPGNLARLMVWADQHYGRPFFTDATTAFLAALK